MAEADPVVVTTSTGKLRGVARGGIGELLGVRYGESTAGAARFRPAVGVSEWIGTRAATRVTPIAPQPYVAGLNDGLAQSEDCLSLNVWFPLEDFPDRSRPVLVVFHGGGFSHGTTNDARHNGYALARDGDIVVVGVNCRLGVLGHLHLADLSNEYTSSGNAGLTDLILALTWVRDNAASLGGNPDEVTIMGQSGGGARVHHLLACPAARTLFARAVCTSGAVSLGTSAEEALATRWAVAKELGIDGTVDEFASQPASTLTQAQKVVAGRDFVLGRSVYGRYGPVAKDVALTSQSASASTALLGTGKPLLVGSEVDGARGYLSESAAPETDSELRQLAISAFGRTGAEAILATYAGPGDSPSPRLVWSEILSDALFRVPGIRLARAYASAAGNGPVYRYEFRWRSRNPKYEHRGAFHGAVEPFFMKNIRALPETESDVSADRLQKKMSDLLISFVWSGAPASDELPDWKPYDPNRETVMVFDQTCSIEQGGGDERALSWASVDRFGIL